MKMKPELLRKILIWVEKSLPDGNKLYEATDITIPHYTQEEINLHVDLLMDGGYFHTTDNRLIFRLSLNGYQLLDMIRKDTVWKKVQKSLADIGMQAIPVLIPIVIEQIKSMIIK